MATDGSDGSGRDFREIAEGVPDGLVLLAADRRPRWVNAAACRLTGRGADECRAMADFPRQLVFPDDRVTFELFEHRVDERQPGNNLPLRMVRRDGTLVWVTLSWQPLHAGGEYHGVCLSLRDMSWTLHNRYLDHFRPVAVEILRDVIAAAADTQRVYRLVTERAVRALGVARVGVWLFDDEGRTLTCASRFSREDGLHLTGATIAMDTCPTYRDAISGNELVVAVDALEDPVTRELGDGYLRPLGIASLLDAPIVRGGRTIGVLCHEHVGRPRTWYETELAFVETLAEFLVLALDTAERQRLVERNQMLASIIEALPDPVVTVALDGFPVYLNHAAHRAQQPREGTGVSEFGIDYARRSYSSAAWKHRNEVVVPAALRDGHWSGEVRLLAWQGEEIPVWQTMVAHRDASGQLTCLSSILRDLRPQKQIERQLREQEAALQQANAELESRVQDRTRRLEELNRSLEAYALSVAHDLQAPLRGIGGFAQALQEDHGAQLPADARRMIDHIASSAARMQQLVTDLLTHARLSSREVRLQRVSVRAAVDEVLAERGPDLASGNVAVTTRFDEVDIQADPGCLGQMLRNLVDNALKYSRDVASPTLAIRVERAGPTVRLVIADNGIGFDMRHHDRIFGLFERLHSGDEYPGTGLGLAIVAKAAERMGGRVWARSAPGQGAQFTVELPAGTPTDEDAPPGG